MTLTNLLKSSGGIAVKELTRPKNGRVVSAEKWGQADGSETWEDGLFGACMA